jgi:hypothetical protein
MNVLFVFWHFRPFEGIKFTKWCPFLEANIRTPDFLSVEQMLRNWKVQSPTVFLILRHVSPFYILIYYFFKTPLLIFLSHMRLDLQTALLFAVKILYAFFISPMYDT